MYISGHLNTGLIQGFFCGLFLVLFCSVLFLVWFAFLGFFWVCVFLFVSLFFAFLATSVFDLHCYPASIPVF